MSLVDPVSRLFLHFERPNRPMHVGGLQLFSLPPDARTDAPERLVNHARGALPVQPPFNQRLQYRLGQPFWVPASNLDMAHHVRHIRLPAPGTFSDLLALVSSLHATSLDRSRPLWEFVVIEGLADGRFAIYTRFHHALMDGISAIRILRRYLAPIPGAEKPDFPWQLAPNEGCTRQSAHRQILRRTCRQTRAWPKVARALLTSWQDAHRQADFTGPLQAPPSLLNVPISGQRRYMARSYPLEQIRKIAHTADATMNDIVLALCASALRHYLIEQNALPDTPLIALVPLSLHNPRAETGNRVGLILASLATDIANPLTRLRTIKRSMDYWKHRYRQMGTEELMAFAAALSAPAALNLLTGTVPRKPAFNVVISNMPGPEQMLYLGDAQLCNSYPLSIILDGQALNISLMSYHDTLEFGLTTCPRALPHAHTLLSYLAAALDELETALHSQPTSN